MNKEKKDVVPELSQGDFLDSVFEYDIVTSNDLLLFNKDNLKNEQHCHTDFAQFSVKQYEEEWKELYGDTEVNLEKLRQKCQTGKLRSSYFRSICWRCLLGILHKQSKQWLCQLKTYRNHYNEVCTELEHNPWNVGTSNPNDNPLSQESESIWQKYFCDEELKSIIQQDVNRTFPDVNFFRNESIQLIMVRILFCYARQNPALCYRQGMHEILAPLIFVLDNDHKAFLHAKEQNLSLDNNMFEILNPENLEQDAYSMFKYIMDHIECSYRINNTLHTSTGQCSLKTEQDEFKSHGNDAIGRLDSIRKNILHQVDPELNNYLEKLDIPLHLFGIRWLRLLFGREFILPDLLVLWDFIFANNFESVNYIVAAMLTAIRDILLKGDYTTCLSNLMRYPNEVDVFYIVESALYIQNPAKYPTPDVKRMANVPRFKVQSSENSKLHSRINGLLSGSSKSSQKLTGKENTFLFAQRADDIAVVVGNTPDDPNVLKNELEQAKLVMSIVHHKLILFHSTLKKNLQNDINTEVQVVLDGIFELSCLLKSHFREANDEIETACEAGEVKDLKISKSFNEKTNSWEHPVTSLNSEKKIHKMRKSPKSGELTVFKCCVGDKIGNTPMTDPLHLIKNSKRES